MAPPLPPGGWARGSLSTAGAGFSVEGADPAFGRCWDDITHSYIMLYLYSYINICDFIYIVWMIGGVPIYFYIPWRLHGAGILNYNTGWFSSGQCWYIFQHHGAYGLWYDNVPQELDDIWWYQEPRVSKHISCRWSVDGGSQIWRFQTPVTRSFPDRVVPPRDPLG